MLGLVDCEQVLGSFWQGIELISAFTHESELRSFCNLLRLSIHSEHKAAPSFSHRAILFPASSILSRMFFKSGLSLFDDFIKILLKRLNDETQLFHGMRFGRYFDIAFIVL